MPVTVGARPSGVRPRSSITYRAWSARSACCEGRRTSRSAKAARVYRFIARASGPGKSNPDAPVELEGNPNEHTDLTAIRQGCDRRVPCQKKHTNHNYCTFLEYLNVLQRT